MSSVSQDNAFGREFLDRIVDWIPTEMSPEDIFSESTLIRWATDKGIKALFNMDEVESYLDDHGKKAVDIEQPHD